MNKFSLRVTGILIVIAGAFLRLYHFFKMDFLHEPFRLGGLFVAFSEQIIQNGFRLPITIPYYSQGGIPFAYPPLGFYIEAIFLSLFPNSRILIANLLPPFISVLTVVAAFLLLRWYYREQGIYVLAGIFAYAFLPSAFTNQIEAAGLAEALGSLALIFFFYCVIRFRITPDWKNAALTGLALGISVLSSPGSAVGASILTFLLGLEILYKNRLRSQAIGQLLMIVIVGGLISAPYWATVMYYHGKGIFIFPVLAQYNNGAIAKQNFFLVLVQNIMNFGAVQNGSVFFWNFVIFLGILWHVSQSKFAMPLAFLVLFTVPREGVWLLALPAAFLVAHGVVDVLLSLIQSSLITLNRWKELVYISLIAFLGCLMAFQSFLVSDALVADKQWKITAEQVKLVEQARLLIPPDGKVLVLGNDALREWSPYLLQREVINTKFGLEWNPTEQQAVTLLNDQISAAQTWDSIYKAVTGFDHLTTVYVLSSDKKLLTALNRNSIMSFKLKVESPDIQLGILGSP